MPVFSATATKTTEKLHLRFPALYKGRSYTVESVSRNGPIRLKPNTSRPILVLLSDQSKTSLFGWRLKRGFLRTQSKESFSAINTLFSTERFF